MYLKTLALKGFKSFADPTTIELEPGVTVVVGPNGSGKSNVVDAVAWVLGAQGPKVVRSQKMDDVIFAGSGKRPALGRAEVTLTIDNSSRLLPVDLNEITITRVLFRSGDSEYFMNGLPCRLLDIQEMLSDSGVGRTQHVIVGQGQLDAVLNAKPEERRMVIEEAAGVLKYRKRREKAERRLEATHSDLQRLQDLLSEVKRSMRPLQRQAEAARRHSAIAGELREVSLYVMGRELARLAQAGDSLESTRLDLQQRSTKLSGELRELDDEVSALEGVLDSIRRDDLAAVTGSLSAIRERATGLYRLIEERQRSLAQAAEVARTRSEVERRIATERDGLAAELSSAIEEAAVATSAMEQAARRCADAEAALAEAEAESRRAEGDHQRWVARVETLAAAMQKARARAGAEKLVGLEGVMGALAELVEVDEGFERAFEAAAGEVMAAVVVDSAATAAGALDRLAADPAGGAVVVAGEAPLQDGVGWSVPFGCEPLRDHVRAFQPEVAGLVDSLVDRAVVVDGDWRRALDVALENPNHVVVTRAGDRFCGRSGRVGAGGTGASMAALEHARTQEESASRAAEGASERLAAARSIVVSERARRDELAQEATRCSERVRLIEQRIRSLDDVPKETVVAVRLAPAMPVEEAGGHLARLSAVVENALREAEGRLSSLLAAQHAQQVRLQEASSSLEGARRHRAALEHELARVREQIQRTEIELAENRMRQEAAVEALRRELDCEPETAIAAECPELPAGVTARQRQRELERELKLLGPINPLALEELEALQERHDFLASQLDDVKDARRELLKVLRAIDAEIVQVFGAAFEDVSRNFADLFDTLFPGGSGRLVLTNPSDLLSTGVEVEARPAGKKVNKLSLLSGGERALTALAFLFAVFRSRPSPFYILDEVEAALDDVSLDRFLGLVDEFRQEAQLIIVSHQKRTMEQADSLYGVSMAPGGSSKVISERLRERPDAA